MATDNNSNYDQPNLNDQYGSVGEHLPSLMPQFKKVLYADNEQPRDTDFNKNSNQISSNAKNTDKSTSMAQNKVQRILDQMKSNAWKIIERDTKLSELNARANTLNLSTENFKKVTEKVEQTANEKYNKMWRAFLVCGLPLLILACICVVVMLFLKNNRPVETIVVAQVPSGSTSSTLLNHSANNL
ncbi:hypothetical protein GJ496_001599 [Pomphorhynchus laevis]|nr:hypothetical protein GJ496_000619 [Pomphorhynchus laevis]KAI0990476.1 hypothetical protein GJ496_001599 [Pomphorhynchus laevis]